MKHSKIFPYGTELTCKYFSGVKDSRYGDLQTRSPVAWDVPGAQYSLRAENGFVNVTLTEEFLKNYVIELAEGMLPELSEPCELGAFTGLTFSLYMSGKFGATKRFAPLPWVLRWSLRSGACM